LFFWDTKPRHENLFVASSKIAWATMGNKNKMVSMKQELIA